MNNAKKIPFVSIVMLNYNGLKYLKETIPAILNLNYRNFEFIIIDNGSSDGSLEFIKSFNSVKLIQSPRLREKNFACNHAIERVSGDFILLCDNDALVTDKNILSELLDRYNNKTGAISLSFFNKGDKKSKSFGAYLGYYFIKENRKIENFELKKYDNCKIGFPSGLLLFISKSHWFEVGGYDDCLKFGGDDNDLGIKLWLKGYENRLYSKTLQIHIGLAERQNNVKYSLKWKEMFHAHLHTIVKNYSFLNMIITIFCYSIFAFLKSIKQSISRLNIGPFLSFFSGYYLFLKNLPVTIKKRGEIQKTRIVKNDIFLKIKPPKVS